MKKALLPPKHELFRRFAPNKPRVAGYNLGSNFMTNVRPDVFRKRMYVWATAAAVPTLLVWWCYTLLYGRGDWFLIVGLPVLAVYLVWVLWRYLRRALPEQTARAGFAAVLVFAVGAQLSMLPWPFPMALRGLENTLLVVVSLVAYLLLPVRSAVLASALLYVVMLLTTWVSIAAHGAGAEAWLAALIRQGGTLTVLLLLYVVAHIRQGWKTESAFRLRQQRLANTDPLTELLNRRGLYGVIERAVALSDDERFCVVLTDIDAFKRVNDLFGHQVGDTVLRCFAAVLKAGLRDGDEVGRWGGEEYLMVLPRTELEGALHVAERLRARVEAEPLLAGHPVTASFGVSAWRAGDTFEGLLQRADSALYRAKGGGKNRVAAESL